jgi:hypothetical protein
MFLAADGFGVLPSPRLIVCNCLPLTGLANSYAHAYNSCIHFYVNTMKYIVLALN